MLEIVKKGQTLLEQVHRETECMPVTSRRACNGRVHRDKCSDQLATRDVYDVDFVTKIGIVCALLRDS